MSQDVHRKLTTILAADAAGYSRIMEEDEVRAMAELHAAREVFAKFIERHHGRVANTAGDGLIAEFPSVVEAVQCANEVQQELGSRPDNDNAMRFRIGIHLGDVLVDGDDLLGEGVNLAARLQSMAEPGGVLISPQVYDQVHAKLSIGFDYLGEKRPKNFSHDVPVYRVTRQGEVSASSWFRRAPERHAAEPQPAEPPRPETTRAEPAPAPPPPPPEGLQDKIRRRARMAGVILAALFVIDIVTGPPLWVQFPAIAAFMVLGLQAVPLYVSEKYGRGFMRGLVITIGLVVINLFTWDGDFWALWPAGIMLAIWLLRRSGRRRAGN